MPRLPRTFQQAVCYPLFNRGINRDVLFHDEQDYRRFIRLLVDCKRRCGAGVCHGALMPNHYHLLIRVPFVMLRPLAAGVQQAYAQFHHRRHGTAGVLWQGRYHTRPVEEDLSLRRCGRYIERNPLRARLVGRAWEWPFSSAAWYVLGRDDELTDVDPQYASELSDPERQAYAAMRQGEADEHWMRQQSAQAIGSPAFVARWVQEHGRPRLRRGRPPKRRVEDVGVSVQDSAG